MTKRDKILLVAILLLAVCVLPWYLYTKNVSAENKALEEQLVALRERKDSCVYTQAALPAKRTQLSQLRQEYQTLTEAYADLNKAYNVHTLFVTMAERNGLRMTALSIGELAAVTLTPAAAEPANDDKAPESKPNVQPYVLRVALSVEGDLASVWQFVDDINAASENFRVETIDGADVAETGTVNVRLQIGVYLVADAPEGSRTP